MNNDQETESREVDGRYRRIVESTPEGIWGLVTARFARRAPAAELDRGAT